MNAVYFYAMLALGLLLDGAYLFRLALFAVFLHESAHILIYIIFSHRLPQIILSAGGICLKKNVQLNNVKTFFVLIAGPLSNFFAAAFFYLSAQQKASYFAYLFCAVNLCIGFFNILPIGMLDGAQIIECFLPTKHLNKWIKFQKTAITLFSILLPIIAIKLNATPTVMATAFIAPFYLIVYKTAY